MPSSEALQRWLDAYVERGPCDDVLREAAALDDGDGEDGARFRYARSMALCAAERPLEALPLLASCVTLARDADDANVEAMAANLLARVYADTGDSAAAHALRDRLEAHARDERVAPDLRAQAGQRAVRLGLGTTEPQGLFDALDALDALDDGAELAWVPLENDGLRALVYVRQGEFEAADQVVLRIEARDAERAASLLLDLAHAAHRAGENGRALRWARTLLERPLGAMLRDAALLCAGMAAWHSGRYLDAAAAFGAVIAAPDACPEDRATARINRALLDMTRGAPLADGDVAFLFSPEAERSPHASVLYHARGQHMLLVEGDAPGALTALDTALALTDATAAPAHAAETLSLRALALAALARHDEAAHDLAEASSFAESSSEAVRARVAQLRAYANSLRVDAPPEAHARVADDLAQAEHGFALVGRSEVASALRRERACAAAERGDVAEALAHVEAAVDDPRERPAAWLACARRAHGMGHIEATRALCDAVLSAAPPAQESLRHRAALYSIVALAAIDARAALDAATAHLARGDASDRSVRQLRINRVGMLVDLGRAVSDDDRAFVLADERLEDALWPDALRAVRASLLLASASPERAQRELEEIPCDSPTRRSLVAQRHALLAKTYADAGRAAPAREHLRRALDLAPHVPEATLPPLLLTLGVVQTMLGDTSAAVESLARCRAHLDAHGRRNVTWRTAQIYLALASALGDEPTREGARADLAALLDDPALDEDHGVRALAQQMAGLIDEDPLALLTASRSFESHDDLLRAWNAAELAATVAGVRGEGAVARSALHRALGLVETLRGRLADGPDRAGMRRTMEHLAARLCTLCALDGDEDAAFAVLLRAHAPNGYAAAEADVSAIAAALPDDAVAVEYLPGDDAVLLAVIDRRGRALIRAPWTADDAAALTLVASVGALVSGAPSDGDLRAVGRALATLSTRLVHPIAHHLTGRTRLVIAAGSEFGVVPFAALSVAPDGPTLLEAEIDCARLLTLSQASSLASLPAAPGPCLLLRGDDSLAEDAPLPFADDELSRIESRLRASGVRVSRGAVDLAAAVEDAALVHYAGHVRRRALGGETHVCIFPQGSVWSSTDLRALTLRRAPVVVLSGCESGDPVTAERDRDAGLVRPLFARGARAVVSSLWPIFDARTVHLMDAFYAARERGHSLERALGEAGRTTLTAALAAGVSPTLARLDAANFQVYALPR